MSTWLWYVIQEPSESSLTLRPHRPRRRYCMVVFPLAWVFESSRMAILTLPTATVRSHGVLLPSRLSPPAGPASRRRCERPAAASPSCQPRPSVDARRRRSPLPARQRLPPHRLRRAGRVAGHRARRADDARVAGRRTSSASSGTASASAPTRRRQRSASTTRSRSTASTRSFAERLADQPACWCELRHAGPRRAHRRLARARPRARAGWASRRPASSTTWRRCWRRCASARTAARSRTMRARRDQRRRPRPRDALLRGALRQGMRAPPSPSTRSSRAAARVPALGRRGAGLHVDRRRRRQRLHPPLLAERDAVEGAASCA